jgi:NTE family protein
MDLRRRKIVLVLSGGGALGAFQGGAYEALAEQDLLPQRVIGTSIGALNGALIAGNAPEVRRERLRAFWERVADPVTPGAVGDHDAGRLGKAAAALHARLVGRPGLYRPVLPRLFLSEHRWGSPSVYDHDEAAATIAELVDFERLGETPLVVALTDLATGDPVFVASDRGGLRPEHVLGSMALIPDFPPVEIGGRLYCDGGLSANLPLLAALDPPPDADLLVIAVDLFGEPGVPAFSVDGMLTRSNDLMFLNQSRGILALAQARQHRLGDRSVAVMMIALDGSTERIAQKTWDFGRRSLAARWEAGREAAMGVRELIERLDAPEPGCLAVHRVQTGTHAPRQA